MYFSSRGLFRSVNIEDVTAHLIVYRITETTEDNRRPTTPTTQFLHHSNPPSSRVRLPSLTLFHHSPSILPTGINPKTSSWPTYHLQ